jgi:hypothetical protein
MTVIRIVALSVLLGSALAALVWFGWGAILTLAAGRGTGAAAPSGAEKETKSERPVKPGKPA